MTISKTDDTRIQRRKPLVTPALLMDEIRPSETALHTVEGARAAVVTIPTQAQTQKKLSQICI